MEVKDHRIINTAIYAGCSDHILRKEFADGFTAAFIALGLSLLRLALIRMSGSSSISQRTPTANAPEPRLPETTTSGSDQDNARRA
jgi:hypothetical protein